MSHSMTRWLEQQATVRERRGWVRRPQARQANSAAIDLASNDYLGLARDPRLAEAAAKAAKQWGTGATASRLVAGTTEMHVQLEAALAAMIDMESALVFSSGYLANMGAVMALGGPGTLILLDEHAHASLVDGCRLSRSRVVTFAHNDVNDVVRHLEERTEPRALVAVESIYSVGGDAAPLPELLDAAEAHDAMLLVDEAHSLGVSGSGGSLGHGSVAATSLAGNPHVLVTATLSKALGSQGGVVLGSSLIREHLLNRARGFIFDTALAPPATAAALAAVDIVRDEPWRAEAVRANAVELAERLGAQNGPECAGAVLSIPMPTPAGTASAAAAAAAANVRIGCFRPPSVPDGISRLRLTAHAGLTPRDIDRACAVLGQILAVTQRADITAIQGNL
ncbi:8-amino-7-oxononanoate synthase [Arthrobacter sp. M4]|uniref:8-amino-7-oxononanoate synthase n=1 Tax=Arthrobacter sp. M4 TaxID=218160 RepID=UPI001CDB5EE3|nr:8-amino-7-oxononanoate synthase [Arthrobacter sp. M4]MCA4133939.1 8-amino-7-oxononanoate synthase [Arthrobacter sp. M4]